MFLHDLLDKHDIDSALLQHYLFEFVADRLELIPEIDAFITKARQTDVTHCPHCKEQIVAANIEEDDCVYCEKSLLP